MSLSDAIQAETKTSAADKNRVDILLDKLEGSPDGCVLRDALTDPRITSAVLTRALQKEYGLDAVKDLSVASWRRKRSTQVDGL